MENLNLMGHGGTGFGIANTAILTILLEMLVVRDHLTNGQVRAIIADAKAMVDAQTRTAGTEDAAGILNTIAAAFK